MLRAFLDADPEDAGRRDLVGGPLALKLHDRDVAQDELGWVRAWLAAHPQDWRGAVSGRVARAVETQLRQAGLPVPARRTKGTRGRPA